MSLLLRTLKALALSTLGLLLALWILGQSLPAERLSNVLQTAALGRLGWTIKAQDVSTSLSGIGLSMADVMIEDSKGKPVMALDTLSLRAPILPLLWMHSGAELTLEDRRGGTLVAAAGATPLGFSVKLQADQFPYTLANYLLEDYGARITGALDLDLHASSPLGSPGALTGAVSIKSENIHIIGGPLLAGFGLAEMDIPGMAGHKDIHDGKLEKLEIQIDGDALYGTLEVGLEVPPELNGLKWEITPHLKFDNALQAKLNSVMPLSGLRKDPKGYWSRNFRGRI